MPFIVIIPARLSATRLPAKPLADIGGKPMVVRVAEQAALSGARKVIVAADHVDIINACKENGVEAYLTRTDHPSGTDRIAEVAKKLSLPDETVVVNVQGDEPLINPQLIKATAEQINAQTPVATAAHAISELEEVFNPNIVKVTLDKNGHALYFSRAPIPWCRDDFAQSKDTWPKDYAPLRHIGLYAYQNAFLQHYPLLESSPLEKNESLEQLRILWHGTSIAVHITPDAPAPGVDTPEDLLRVQTLFNNEQSEKESTS